MFLFAYLAANSIFRADSFLLANIESVMFDLKHQFWQRQGLFDRPQTRSSKYSVSELDSS